MMVDPVEALLKKTSSLLVPTSSATHTVSPIPTVVPGPSRVFEKVGGSGATTLWVVFVIMLLSTLAFIWMAFKVPVQKRVFHVLTALITTFATLSYFAMATGAGGEHYSAAGIYMVSIPLHVVVSNETSSVSFAHTVIRESHKHTGVDTVTHVFRQVFWARYIDWSLTTPLLLLDLAFLAGMNGASILVVVVADVIMVLLGLFAAFGKSDAQKWGWYGMACLAYLVIVYQLVVSGRRAAMTKDNSTSKLFASIGGFTLILWTLYPIVWGIGDGARKMGVDAEIICYAVLDVLAKPVFGFWLLFAHTKNVTNIEGFWSRGLGGEGSVRLEDDDN
ncbi:putative opsin-1 [Coleophoma crateriformis]|uniref:Putative opsin-1 n=1 Tax=Coleophoma crateriformis TaxID=565419 RepID=A0A3D8T9E0_9HELO|nr:putative opsin-1 [Coleophoma crateriformis]